MNTLSYMYTQITICCIIIIINITLIIEVTTPLLSTSTELYDLLVLCNSEREREGGREGGREEGRGGRERERGSELIIKLHYTHLVVCHGLPQVSPHKMSRLL